MGRLLADGGGLKSFVRVLRLLEPADLKSCRQVSMCIWSTLFIFSSILVGLVKCKSNEGMRLLEPADQGRGLGKCARKERFEVKAEAQVTGQLSTTHRLSGTDKGHAEDHEHILQRQAYFLRRGG